MPARMAASKRCTRSSVKLARPAPATRRRCLTLRHMASDVIGAVASHRSLTDAESRAMAWLERLGSRVAASMAALRQATQRVGGTRASYGLCPTPSRLPTDLRLLAASSAPGEF
jgi:hypothetical protein